ncbi:MAG: domain S-box-containing protein [Myxococcales bacterium]|nr:domain S-box-containing protein [Myxococcales bacterium]
MNRPDLNESVAPVLAVVDRTVLVGIPCIAAGAILVFPAGSPTWLRVLGAGLLVVWGLSLLGTMGRAPWRRGVYPTAMLGLSVLALWTQGPTAGVGATFGLAVLLAGALWSRTGLWVMVAVASAAILVRVSDVVPSLGSGTVMSLDGLRIWIRIALTVGVVSWIAARVLGALIASLEQSYERAAEAYRIETETRTRLDSSRQELDEVEHLELVGRLAGGVAHDINNALTAILAASDLLGEKVATHGQRTSLADLEGASHHAAELVRDLLWIGRKFPPTTTTADVVTTVDACLRRLERMGRKIELAVETPSVRVALAPERLEQILFRLVLRADRAEVSQLSLTVRRVGGMIELDLRGVEKRQTATSSAPFRLKSVSARLGMSAAKEVVEQAGGSLTISGQDNVVSVHICLRPADDEPAAVLPAIDRPRIALVVDDEPLVLGRLSKLIGRRGYTVTSASSLAEAWPLLAAGPDLLVTDLQLGDGDGEELAIASFERAPERPIVVCSGFGADDDLRHRLRDAHVRFLPKPFTMTELESAIPHATQEVA